MTHILIELAKKHGLRLGIGIHEPLRVTNEIEIYHFDREIYCVSMPRKYLDKLVTGKIKVTPHQIGDDEIIIKIPWDTDWDKLLNILKGVA